MAATAAAPFLKVKKCARSAVVSAIKSSPTYCRFTRDRGTVHRPPIHASVPHDEPVRQSHDHHRNHRQQQQAPPQQQHVEHAQRDGRRNHVPRPLAVAETQTDAAGRQGRNLQGAGAVAGAADEPVEAFGGVGRQQHTDQAPHVVRVVGRRVVQSHRVNQVVVVVFFERLPLVEDRR